MVCDGSDGLRLVIAFDGQLDREYPYSAVQYELGAPYVYVDGRCQYWLGSWDLNEPFAFWRPIRTGSLTSDEQASLAGGIAYDDIGALASCSQSPTGSDVPIAHIFDGARLRNCYPDPDLQAAWFGAVSPLYDRGTPLTSALRIEVGVGGTPVTNLPPHPWPLAEPLPDFVVPPENQFSGGVSRLVSDPGDVSALLALRDEYLSEEAPHIPPDPAIEIEGRYLLYMREEVPFTDASGIVSQFAAP